MRPPLTLDQIWPIWPIWLCEGGAPPNLLLLHVTNQSYQSRRLPFQGYLELCKILETGGQITRVHVPKILFFENFENFHDFFSFGIFDWWVEYEKLQAVELLNHRYYRFGACTFHCAFSRCLRPRILMTAHEWNCCLWKTWCDFTHKCDKDSIRAQG